MCTDLFTSKLASSFPKVEHCKHKAVTGIRNGNEMSKYKDEPGVTSYSPDTPQASGSLNAPLVLLIEEDSFQTQLVERTLEHIPEIRFLSLLPENEHALSVVLREKPDLVLINLELKKGNAFTLMEALQSHPLSRHTPVFALCDSGKIHEAEKARRAGFKQCLSQPIKIYELIEKVKSEIEDILHQKQMPN